MNLLKFLFPKKPAPTRTEPHIAPPQVCQVPPKKKFQSRPKRKAQPLTLVPSWDALDIEAVQWCMDQGLNCTCNGMREHVCESARKAVETNPSRGLREGRDEP